jgi:hypothetical protein
MYSMQEKVFPVEYETTLSSIRVTSLEQVSLAEFSVE